MPRPERLPAPRLEAQAPPWSISQGADGREAIVATKGRTALLRGEAGAAVLRGENPALVTGKAPSTEPGPVWPEQPDILADCALPGATRRWQGAESLGLILGQAGPPAYLLIAAEPAAAFGCFEATQTAFGRWVTPVVIHGELIIVGPLFSGERWPCRWCWCRRLRSNLPALDARIRRRHTVVVGDTARLARYLATARTLWEARAPGEPRDRAITVDLERGAVTSERILPLAGCSCLHDGGPVHPDDLVGRCFGAVQAIGSPSHPLAAEVAVLTARTRRAALADIGGAAGAHGPTTRLRVIAEAIERLAGETSPSGVFRAGLEQVPDAPPAAELNPYTGQQYRSAGFPFRPLQEESTLRWVEGVDLATGRPRPVPLALVTFLDQETAFAPPSSTGRAAGRSWPAAAERALFEIAERDVVTRRWFEGEATDADVSEWAPVEQRLARASGLEARLAVCRDEDVPVAVAAVADRHTGLGALGSAAAATLAASAPHAVEEALLMHAHRWTRGTLVPVDDVWFASGAPGCRGRWTSVRIDELVRRYRPLAVVLTTPEAAAAGLEVAALWSPSAVDFPRPGLPLPLARWSPGEQVRRRIAAIPDLFAGGDR